MIKVILFLINNTHFFKLIIFSIVCIFQVYFWSREHQHHSPSICHTFPLVFKHFLTKHTKKGLRLCMTCMMTSRKKLLIKHPMNSGKESSSRSLKYNQWKNCMENFDYFIRCKFFSNWAWGNRKRIFLFCFALIFGNQGQRGKAEIIRSYF